MEGEERASGRKGDGRSDREVCVGGFASSFSNQANGFFLDTTPETALARGRIVSHL